MGETRKACLGKTGIYADESLSKAGAAKKTASTEVQSRQMTCRDPIAKSE